MRARHVQQPERRPWYAWRRRGQCSTRTPPATSSPKQTKSATQTSATVPETLRFSGTTVDGKPFDGASLVGAAAAAIALAKSSLTERLRRSGRFVPTLAGLLMIRVGAYVSYYGLWEIRVLRDGPHR